MGRKREYARTLRENLRSIKQQEISNRNKLILEHVQNIDLLKLSSVHLNRYKILIGRINDGKEISSRHWNYLGKLVFDFS